MPGLGLTVTIRGSGGSVAEALQAELGRMSAASVKAMRYTTNNTKVRLRAVTAPALGPRVANAWRDVQYPNDQGLGPDSRGMVWSRAPRIIASAEEAPLIRAHNSQYLAIPEPAAGVGPGGRRITPAEFKKKTGIPLRFVRLRNGQMFLVAQAESRKLRLNARGRLIGRQRGGGFSSRQFDPSREFVPVFHLVRAVQMKKLIDVTPIADQGQIELGNFLEATLNAATGEYEVRP